ncbi:MAG: carboxypeptidase M32 [Thermaerobacterales bacterium]
MSKTEEKYRRLLEILGEVDDLDNILTLLHWDEQTKMPKGGARARADHKTTLHRLIHGKFAAPEVGELLAALEDYEAGLPYDSDDAAILRTARRSYEQVVKIPEDLVVRKSRAASEAFRAWVAAREARDFSLFEGSLKEIYALQRETAEALGYDGHPIDALLQMSEPGMTVAQVDRVFAQLREGLVPLVAAIAEKLDAVDDSVLRQKFARDQQWAISEEAVRAIGFDLDRNGRLDLSIHPFATNFSPEDVRITTRMDENFLSMCFFACLHEAGHGLYMQGIPTRYRRTPLISDLSSAVHESQSRMWENLVGRSRAFWQFFYPRMQAMFPAQLAAVDVETFYRACNRSHPSLIRVEADEVTYNLHIMIRYELEKDVFDGRLQISDLPEAWQAKFQDYLGIQPANDLEGILQDIHWSGRFGASFVSYALGNVISGQLWQAAQADVPDLAAQFGQGSFSPLLEWTRKHVHGHGAKYTPEELVERATGKSLSVEPYLNYIQGKFTELYDL